MRHVRRGERGGDASDALYGPRDVAVDSEGYVYVGDTGNKRVIKYDLEGNMVEAVGGAGDAKGLLQEPVGVAVTRTGRSTWPILGTSASRYSIAT